MPDGVVTTTFRLVPEPAGTTAVMLVAELTVIEVAAVPPKVTEVAPVKPVPVSVTEAPAAALVGDIDVISGAGSI